MVTMGPDQKFSVPAQDTLSDEESMEEDQTHEDHYALLVKAWEQKVFPTIRRRFRNEAERKDGLEQIRGALQLGKTLWGNKPLPREISFKEKGCPFKGNL